VRDLNTDYQCPSNNRHVNIVRSDDVDDSKVVENVYVPFEIISVIENTLVDSSPPILDEVHVFFEGISNVVDTSVESNTPISDDIYAHEGDTSDSEYILVESSMPVQLLGIHLSHI